MPPIPGSLHSLVARHAKVWKAAWKEASKAIKSSLEVGQPKVQLQPVRIPVRQPLHPAARIRQTQSRWFSTKRTINDAVRRFTTSASQTAQHTTKNDRASFPKSSISIAVSRSSGRAPFASTLRPNLTGGTLARTAGGYSLGAGRVGGARYFSHGPASQSQVVQNVSQAVRAFFDSGRKAQFDGTTRRGEKRYKDVSALQEETGRKMRSLPKATPGSYIDFSVNPTITALTPMNAVLGYSIASTNTQHLNADGLLDVLSVDFSRALKELAAVLNDLKRLSTLGDLPITYQESSLRVHFPGCDLETVQRLCSELNMQRGVVVQDEDFDAYNGTEMALLFPFAPSSTPSEVSALYDNPMAPAANMTEEIDWRNMLSQSEQLSEKQATYSTRSESGFEDLHDEVDNPWVSSPSGYGSLACSSEASRVHSHDPLEYQGFEGIYRFIEQCDAARR